MLPVKTVLFGVFLAGTCSAVLVDTEYGQVRGKTMLINNTRLVRTVDVFRGIPYAKDTSGVMRFRSPEEVDPWSGVFEADQPGDMCPQILIGTLSSTHPEWDSFSENCLHVDIVSPNVTGGPYPVMFWIHGGAFYQGGNVQYPGHFLSLFDVVVVSINYRLGNLGFAFTGNDAAPGNAGLWDQKMALDFVVNNIANFGGDPSQITVFGESAGGGSTGLLMVSPQTKDLFQRAILQSGSETNIWTINVPESNPVDYTYQAAESLGCGREADDEAMMDCLRQKDWEQLVYNVSITCTPGYYCGGLVPTVDSPSGFLPKTPTELRQEGDIMTGPIMAGINRDDGSLFVPLSNPGTLFGCCNRTNFQRILRESYLGVWSPKFDDETTENIYQAMDWRYSPWPYIHENEHNREALVRIMTEMLFGVAWDTQIKQHQEVAPTYGYMFNYRSDLSSAPEWMGVTHAADVGYVWGLPLFEINPEVKSDGNFTANITYNEKDIEQSLFMQEMWTNFAKFGNPSPSPVDNPQGGSTVWPLYGLDEMEILHFSNVTETIYDYEQKMYAFWGEYMDYLEHGTPSYSAAETLQRQYSKAISPSPLMPVLIGQTGDDMRLQLLDLLNVMQDDFEEDWTME